MTDRVMLVCTIVLAPVVYSHAISRIPALEIGDALGPNVVSLEVL